MAIADHFEGPNFHLSQMCRRLDHLKPSSPQLCLALVRNYQAGRLDENIGSLSVKMSKEEEQKIRRFCDEGGVCGERYPKSFMAACGADIPPL